MKKLHTVLWVVFVSLAVSGLTVVFFRPTDRHELSVAKVNGEKIYFNDYTRALSDLHERLNALRPYARMYGMSEEAFFGSILGANSPEEIALDGCIKNKLLDTVKKTCAINVDEDWFKAELVKTLPHLTDESGFINMDAYHQYLQKLSMTAAEYEEQREEDLKREVVNKLAQNTAYVPRFAAKEVFEQEHGLKSFKILVLPFDHFLTEARKHAVSDKDLEIFYLKNKEMYRVSEKRKAKYWFITPEDYANKIDIDDQTIQSFYEKNKGSLYRVAPKIKVRYILLKIADKSKQASTDIYIRAQQIAKEAQANPKNFTDLVKKYSDAPNAKDGGETAFFGRQTFDPEFERAAFRLQKNGDVSDIVKTKEGYQIIQLVERQAAAEKPLDLVRDDIIKAVKTRKTQNALRSDMERLMYSLREDKNALEKFAQEFKLSGGQTEWLTEEDAKEDSFASVISQKLFGQKKQTAGYFAHGSKYVVYQQSDIEKSAIPLLHQIRAEVEEDYYHDMAGEIAKQKIKDMRGLLLDKKVSLEQLGHEAGHTVKVTGKISKGDKLPGFEKIGNLGEMAFALIDPVQVLHYVNEGDHYIVQLQESEANTKNTFDQEMAKIIKQEKFKNNTMQQAAFIASLHRNAKIEIEEKLLEGNRKQEKD